MLDADEKREAEDLKLRVERTVTKKIDRAVDKQIITPAEAKLLDESLTKEAKKHKAEWWLDEKIYTSFEIASHLLGEAELGTYPEEREILAKIEKA